ncbi:unnamed protein product [Arctogadus glacialis]
MRAGLACGRLDLEDHCSTLGSQRPAPPTGPAASCSTQTSTHWAYSVLLHPVGLQRPAPPTGPTASCATQTSTKTSTQTSTHWAYRVLLYHDDTTSGPLLHPGLTASCSTHWAYSILLHPDLHPLGLQRPAPPRPPPTGPTASCSTQTSTHWAYSILLHPDLHLLTAPLCVSRRRVRVVETSSSPWRRPHHRGDVIITVTTVLIILETSSSP